MEKNYYALEIDLKKNQFVSLESAIQSNPYLIYELEIKEQKNLNFINYY